MVDTDDINNKLSKNLRIINIDIASCFKLAYNNTKLNEISDLERFAAIIYCEYLEDISNILGGDLLNMEEKERFLESIREKSEDKDVNKAVRLEDNIDYRFDLVREEALEQGINQTVANNVRNMVKKNIDIKDIADITGKSVDEVKVIIKDMNDL